MIFKLTVFAVALASLSASAQGIPPSAGWHSLPNTKIRLVCPSGSFGDCANVTAAWNSAVFDSTRNRFIVWGGGHNDYSGNELYALNVGATPITMTRLNNPSTQVLTACGIGTTGDSPAQAAARHTYDHIVYMSHIDRMFVFGGASTPCGFMLDDTWTFSFASMIWENRNPLGPKPEANYGRATGYDPTTHKVYIADQLTLYSYTYETNAYVAMADHPTVLGQEMTGVMDTTRHLFVMIGNGSVVAYDVNAANPAMQTWNTTGATTMITRNNPGVAYDPDSDRIVAWDGGNTVYSLNIVTKVWTSTASAGGPVAMSNGTFKRWAYSLASKAFVTVNSVDADAVAFRLTAGAGTGGGAGGLGGGTGGGSGTGGGTTGTGGGTTGTGGGTTGTGGGSSTPKQNAIGGCSSTGPSLIFLGTSLLLVLQLRRRSRLGSLLMASVVSVSGLANAQVTPDTDFSVRRTAAGVVKSVGFDNTTADIVKSVNLWPGDGNYWGGSMDTTIKASGGGALHFFLPGNRATSDISGSWNAPLGGSFGPNSDFYVQFRIRISPEMLTNIPNWRSSVPTAWKSVLFHRDGSTCGQIEITTTNDIWGNSGAPQMYSGCGSPGFTNTSPGGSYSYSGNLSQQGASISSGFNCDFNSVSNGSGNGIGCFIWEPNKWMTIYYHVHLGDLNGGANSNVEAYVAMDGQPYKQWINIKNIPLSNDGAGFNHYDSITFTPYMTNLSSVGGADASVWYDELIVSTQPIAAPGTTGGGGGTGGTGTGGGTAGTGGGTAGTGGGTAGTGGGTAGTGSGDPTGKLSPVAGGCSSAGATLTPLFLACAVLLGRRSRVPSGRLAKLWAE